MQWRAGPQRSIQSRARGFRRAAEAFSHDVLRGQSLELNLVEADAFSKDLAVVLAQAWRRTLDSPRRPSKSARCARRTNLLCGRMVMLLEKVARLVLLVFRYL